MRLPTSPLAERKEMPLLSHLTRERDAPSLIPEIIKRSPYRQRKYFPLRIISYIMHVATPIT
jgi:hypothetical protein|uniref:Uncharacterized protein n=1 Tax=Picea glauca TaxID=3330 RepID=A0A124GNE3_PICGL|nr:hypothetical protein ABT39_MTgene4576 [Picea glauca]QHR88162.1 hypothetical protein Q903MT_gene2175 [Picea sitchensis]